MSAEVVFIGPLVQHREEKTDDGTEFDVFTQMVLVETGKPFLHDYWIMRKLRPGHPQEQVKDRFREYLGKNVEVECEAKPKDGRSVYKLTARHVQVAASASRPTKEAA